MSHAVTAPAIFFFTLYLVLVRPRNIDTGLAAVVGAALALVTGVITLADVRTVAGIVWDATFALIAIMVISVILDQAGVFRWAALQMARRAGGHGGRIFLAVIVLGAGVTTLFTNDATVLILTPIIYEMLVALGFDGLAIIPYMMACGFVADAMSVPLAVSNLTNMISARYFDIPFGRFALVMLLPSLFCLGASTLVLRWFYRRQIPGRYDESVLEEPAKAIRDPLLFKVGIGVLAAMVVAFFINSTLMRVPVSFVIAAGALVLLVAAFRGRMAGRQSQAVDPVAALKGAPWGIIAFALGMNLVVYGLGRSGLTSLLVRWLEALAGQGLAAAIFGTGALTSVMSGLFNNLPAVMTGSLAVKAAAVPESIRQAMVFANVIGSDVGAKLTPIGSLATLMWLNSLVRKGVNVKWADYFRVITVITIPVLFAALLALWIGVRLMG